MAAARAWADKTASALPCLLITAGILNGSLILVLKPETPLSIALLSSLPGIAVAFAVFRWRAALKFAIPSALGLGSALLNAHLPSNHYTRMMDRPNCGAVIEAIAVDSSCCGKDVEWLPNPKNLEAELRHMKFTKDDLFEKVSGSVALRLPEDAPKIGYGDTLLLSGAFLEAEGPLFKGAFDYKRFLASKGVARVFNAKSCEVKSRGEGPMRTLLDARDAFLSSLCRKMSGDGAKKLAAALVFGCRQGIDWRTRRDFIRSGTVHILTVSGLHVGMVAAILLLALRPLPFRIRHLAVPAIVLLYALTTGMQAPAIRAFSMLAVWCVMRALLLSTPALNAVLLAAAGLLLWNPSQALDAGFQYSFLAVAFLIGSTKSASAWMDCVRERLKWIPSKLVPYSAILKTRAAGWALKCVAGCVVAWLASCGLTLLYQGLYAPYAIPANIILLPVTWLTFALFGAGSVLLWAPGAAWLVGRGLDALLSLMTWVCGFFASFGGSPSPQPPVWTVALLLSLLAVFLGASKRKVLLASFAGLLIVLSAWGCMRLFEKPELAVLHGGGAQEPAIIICSPRSGFAAVVGVPDFDAARDMASYLASKGIGSVEQLVMPSPGRDFCGGAKYLISFMDVKALAMPEYKSNAVAADECVEAAMQARAEVKILDRSKSGESSFSSSCLKTFSKSGLTKIECATPEFKIDIVVEDDGRGVKRLLAKDAWGNVLKDMTLENSGRRSLATAAIPEECP